MGGGIIRREEPERREEPAEVKAEVSRSQKPSTLLGKSCLVGVDVKSSLEDISFASYFT